MKIWADPHFRAYFYGLFAVYTGIGLFGTAWITDEFDPIRLSITSYITMPALCLFLAGFIDDRQYWRKWPKLFVSTAAIVIATLVWGHLILLNAIGGSDRNVISQAFHAMTVNTDARRGAFGWVYQKRW